MKKFILAVSIMLFGATAFAVETKKTCIDQKDPKTQKTTQVCKDVKVHKKLEGTAIPGAKASAPKATASKASAAK